MCLLITWVTGDTLHHLGLENHWWLFMMLVIFLLAHAVILFLRSDKNVTRAPKRNGNFHALYCYGTMTVNSCYLDVQNCLPFTDPLSPVTFLSLSQSSSLLPYIRLKATQAWLLLMDGKHCPRHPEYSSYSVGDLSVRCYPISSHSFLKVLATTFTL